MAKVFLGAQYSLCGYDVVGGKMAASYLSGCQRMALHPIIHFPLFICIEGDWTE